MVLIVAWATTAFAIFVLRPSLAIIGQGWPGLVSKLQPHAWPISRLHVIITLAPLLLTQSCEPHALGIISLIANAVVMAFVLAFV